VSVTWSKRYGKTGAVLAHWRGCSSLVNSELIKQSTSEIYFHLSKETMSKRQPYVCLTRAQHKALEQSVHELMEKQTGSGYAINTRAFTDVPYAASMRFYVRKSPEGPGFYDDMQQMIGRGIDWGRLGHISDEVAGAAQNVAGGLATAGALSAATGIGVAATPFLEGAAGIVEGVSLGARGVGAVANIAQA
jgi:hypothetical protein